MVHSHTCVSSHEYQSYQRCPRASTVTWDGPLHEAYNTYNTYSPTHSSARRIFHHFPHCQPVNTNSDRGLPSKVRVNKDSIKGIYSLRTGNDSISVHRVDSTPPSPALQNRPCPRINDPRNQCHLRIWVTILHIAHCTRSPT